MSKKRYNQGFTLFIAIVVTGVVLLVATSIISLAFKQSLISNSGKESQVAFYAADTAMECALYWDVHNLTGESAFATSTTSTVTCNQDANNTGNQWTVGGSSVSTMSNITFLPEAFCATVTVTKNANGTTLIEAKGYNTCAASARRVERAVRASY